MFIKFHNERNKPYIEEPLCVAFTKTFTVSLIVLGHYYIFALIIMH